MNGVASNIAEHVDSAFNFILGTSILLLVLITCTMIYFVIRYNRKKNPVPADIKGNSMLEAVWIAIPTVLVMFMFYYGWTGFNVMRDIPEDAMEVKVSSRMWSWSFHYENGFRSDTLYLPVDRPVKLVLSSQDVIHSFFIPAFRVKEDTVPGMDTYLWFRPTIKGTFDLLCAEYCGLKHSDMLSKVIVMEVGKFNNWYAENTVSAETKQVIPVKELLDEHGCLDCHSVDGTVEDAPSFKGLFGRKEIVITEGREREIIVDEDYIKRSILDPEADLVKGFDSIMSSYEDEIGEKDIDRIVEYLKGIK